jgi:nucleoid-associated protein YgaU
MTRETKIGLLVGLAFIIVIGILLSDHMTSTTEPPKAPLSVAGNNVRESVMSPGAAPAVAAVATQGQVAPNQTVLTSADIAAPQPAAPQVIQIGPGQSLPQSPIVVQQAPIQQAIQQIPVQVSPGVAQVTQPPVTVADAPVIITPPSQRQSAAHPLQQNASRLGEEIVGVGEPANGAQQGTAAAPVPMAPLREYKAQADDTLSKMAGRFLGGNTKANRDAIIRVNPTLQQNPDKIVAGRTYVIPPAPGGESIAAVPAPAPAAPRTPAPQAAPETGNFQWYTVKENENLWKIAAEQLGSGNAWTQIRDLNPDVLKGEDRVKSNMRIRIPNKPMASAH